MPETSPEAVRCLPRVTSRKTFPAMAWSKRCYTSTGMEESSVVTTELPTHQLETAGSSSLHLSKVFFESTMDFQSTIVLSLSLANTRDSFTSKAPLITPAQTSDSLTARLSRSSRLAQ